MTEPAVKRALHTGIGRETELAQIIALNSFWRSNNNKQSIKPINMPLCSCLQTLTLDVKVNITKLRFYYGFLNCLQTHS
jgi:hypothetical protein